MKTAGLLLAAGAGRRLGQPKATVRHEGMTLAERGVRLLTAGGCAPVLVVAGAAADEVKAELAAALPSGTLSSGTLSSGTLPSGTLPSGTLPSEVPSSGALPDVRVVVAADWASGMGASLGAGLRALADTDAQAVVVTLVDQPWLGAEAVRALVAAARAGLDDALIATYQGKPGHPVLLHRRIWAEVAADARGDVGARGWLRAHPDRVQPVPCDGTGSPADVDVPGDLAHRPRD